MRSKIRKILIPLAILAPVVAGRCLTPESDTAPIPCRTEATANGDVYYLTLVDDSWAFDSVRYAVYIPRGVERIRGVFVHQHGCTMEGRGEFTAYDVQYQAFAKKWGLAVVGPDIWSASGNCFNWRDTETGSADALIRMLDEVGYAAGHPELSTAPWLLWGHSGGGYWALSMLRDYPERTIAVFGYSPGTGASWDYPAAALKVPLMMRHAGPDGDPLCWMTSVNNFGRIRQAGGYASIAHTPGQNHNYSFVRYMAIPFYEAVMAQRFGDGTSSGLRDMDHTLAWLGDTLSLNIHPAARFDGRTEGMSWLPDSLVAAKWREYVITGTVADRTPPPPPTETRLKVKSNRNVEIAWKADADVESGIHHFNIFKGGSLIGRFPASGEYQRFDTNGDDAYPATTLPELKLELTGIVIDDARISISTVNHFSLESPRVEFPQ
jgi:pimeloyl-ACP methyl ester carboxylesterase